MYYVPVLVVVAANTIYHVAAKGMPNTSSTFAPLIWTYLTAMVVTVVMFFLTSPTKDLFVQMRATNVAPFILGAAVVGLEFGFVLLYKVGWNISIGPTVCNILVGTAVLVVGVLVYKEHISMQQIIGIALCGAGLFFINK